MLVSLLETMLFAVQAGETSATRCKQNKTFICFLNIITKKEEEEPVLNLSTVTKNRYSRLLML